MSVLPLKWESMSAVLLELLLCLERCGASAACLDVLHLHSAALALPLPPAPCGVAEGHLGTGDVVSCSISKPLGSLSAHLLSKRVDSI